MNLDVYRPEDVNEAATLFVTVFAKAPWNETWDQRDAEEHLRRIADGRYGVGFVARDDRGICGVLLGRLDRWRHHDAFTIEELYVRDQRRGIGSALLVHAERHLLERGVTSISLVTRDDTPASAFYAKHGYTVGRNDTHLHFGKRIGPQMTRP